MASRIAALVPRGAEAGEFDPAWFSTPECRVMSLAMKFGMMAADEAVEDAAWKGSDLEEEQGADSIDIKNCPKNPQQIWVQIDMSLAKDLKVLAA